MLHFVEGVDSYIYPEADDDMILFYSVRGLEHIVTEKLGSIRRVVGGGRRAPVPTRRMASTAR